MRITVANNVKTSIPKTKSALEYLTFVEECLHSADKSLTGSLMVELTNEV